MNETSSDLELLPYSRSTSLAELYAEFADSLESHPNYEARKDRAPAGEMTLKQYVGYCRERATENYTNELAGEMAKRFKQYLELLD